MRLAVDVCVCVQTILQVCNRPVLGAGAIQRDGSLSYGYIHVGHSGEEWECVPLLHLPFLWSHHTGASDHTVREHVCDDR